MSNTHPGVVPGQNRVSHPGVSTQHPNTNDNFVIKKEYPTIPLYTQRRILIPIISREYGQHPGAEMKSMLFWTGFYTVTADKFEKLLKSAENSVMFICETYKSRDWKSSNELRITEKSC